MARVVSFVVLIAILLVIGGMFFQVMAGFLLPIFLALLLAALFRPVHDWLTARCGGRQRLSAALTTIVILLIVLAPIMAVLLKAVSESVAIYGHVDPSEISVQKLAGLVVQLGNHVGVRLTAEDVQQWVIGTSRDLLYPMARGTTQFVGGFLMGLVVMVISLYYFLADGPEMVRAITQLSPLDERYQFQLIDRFGSVSRAVVLATLLSAVVQGLLAGVGFYLAGLPSLFLLMVVTMLLAMVPFIGPPIGWCGACLWLYFVEGRPVATIVMAVYGTVIVSTVDNIVRPAVLHGRSNLHPLLALLSVLGGVQSLGAIGIFVGPMVVAFLQTLLHIVRDELQSLSAGQGYRAEKK